MAEEYRMPDGKWVSDAMKMSRAWAKIYKPICKEFGVDVIGFDPNISFRRGVGADFEIPTDIAIWISNKIREEQSLKRNLKKAIDQKWR